MDDRTLTALKASIAKWERNAVAERPEDYDVARKSCALCDSFWDDDCDGCPVSQMTGHECCAGTPYTAAAAAVLAWKHNPVDDCVGRAQAAARDEVAFLRSLLPSAD